MTSSRKRAVFGSVRPAIGATRQLVGRPDLRCAGDIDVDVVVVAGCVTTVCVCEPRHVWTLVTSFGCAMSVMSENANAADATLLTGSGTPRSRSRCGWSWTPTT